MVYFNYVKRTEGKRMFYKYESTLDNDLIFWSNATADLRHNGEIGEDDLPDELLHALNELWTDGHLVSCYLVELKGRYGIALESIYDRDFAESLGITYGHIASYMSLTDCWVLGILPVPTYVTAGYSINGYIEDLGERIAKEESAGRRAELLADFNELRDCASRAANLPAIFQKYFEGIEKVIVFCPNVFELNEIEKMCPRWFSRVNGNVHTYVVHSSNPFGTSEYDGFKEDDDETAIKLLLCVNQLNEGVHIKGVDAVIMVRRTSSPTIFYQQLGRALTAAGNFEPLVIDLVDNFEMIGIEQIVSMMSESYARLSGENDPEELIPPSAFKVIDHEKDARNLAKNLERRLALRSEKLTIDEKIALWKGL